MKIRPKNILSFQNGGVPQWYLDRYGNRTKLLGWDLNQRYNYADNNLMTNDHRNAGNLDTVYRKNIAYTGTPGAISTDIQAFYNSDGKGMSAEDFVKFYNENAAKIRSHWTQDQTYNKDTAGDHNRLFRRMFQSRSNMSQSPGSDYNIGYLLGLTKGGYDILDIEGSSTWLRRMDLYEHEFDPNNPDSNRLHEITLKDGTKAIVYKKANGDIGLLKNINPNNPNDPNNPNSTDPNNPTDPNNKTQVPVGHLNKYGFDWNKIGQSLLNILGNPDIWAAGRLAGNLINNERVYNEQLKGINPVLRLTYNTHRQVVGDEATKQAYYRRAAQGLTQAARPFTSDADRQMAYQMEAKRVGDELRAQGDLADNQEIRRTSDESNQHLWANIQRATEVANANTASINQAKALKHNLLAQKHSAQWSSIDNFLQGIEYRKRQKLAEQQALDDLIFTLLQQLDLLYDPRIINGLKQLLTILEKHKNSDGSYNYENDEVKAAIRNYKNILFQVTIDSYNKKKEYYKNRGSIFTAKSGTKIIHKKKDDLLYMSVRDVVDHFRKMTKLSSDALNRKKPKIEKLTSHPKGNTKKYLLGGVAPFTIYKPIALGGETTTAYQGDTSNINGRGSSSNKSNDGLDLMKDLFKNLAVEGLPSDVNGIYKAMNNLMSRSRAFGEELSTEDIASMYILQMLLINAIKFNKSQFDKVAEIVNSKDAGSEYAIDLYGRLAVLNVDTGDILYKSWDEVKNSNKLNPLTNNDLLNLRAYSPDQAFNSNIIQTISNATSMTEIAKFLKEQFPNIGNSESTIEGYTKLDSNQIKAGLLLLKDAPPGDYKFTQYNKDQLKLALIALNYLKSSLPKNMKALLLVNSEMQGTSINEYIAYMIGSTLSENSKLEFDAVTGKAAKDANGNSKSFADEDITPAAAFFAGLGERHIFNIQDKTNDALKVYANSMSLLDSQNHNLGPTTLMNINQGAYGGQLDMKSATMGDVKISDIGQNNVLVGDGKIYSAELPIDRQAALAGIIKPDLSFLKNIEKADEELRSMGITNRDNLTSDQIDLINKIYAKHNLPILYNKNGDGKPILTSEYRRFAMLNGYATENAFEGDMNFNDGAIEVNDDKELDQFESMMQTITKNEKYKLDRGIFSGTDVYKGVIYIPMVSSTVAALAGTGYKASPQDFNAIDAKDLQADYIRKTGLNIQGSFTN